MGQDRSGKAGLDEARGDDSRVRGGIADGGGLLECLHEFLDLFPGCAGAVDFDVDGDLVGALADGRVDAQEAAEIGFEAQRQADFIEGDVPCCGEECEGGRVATGQALQEVFGGADRQAAGRAVYPRSA